MRILLKINAITMKCSQMQWPLKYMFKNLNQVPMCSENEDIANSMFSTLLGGHLGFMQIRWYSTPWIHLDFLYVMWG